jgi:hypothetical protein
MKKLQMDEMANIAGLSAQDVLDCMDDKLFHRGWSSIALLICCGFSPWSTVILAGACAVIPEGTANW